MISDEKLKTIIESAWALELGDPLPELASELLAARKELAEMKERERFIPVSERLPEKETNDIGEEYLAFLGFYDIVLPVSFIQGRFYHGTTDYTDRVIAWRPFPSAPEVE